MKSNLDNSYHVESILPTARIVAVLVGLISAGSVAWFLDSSPLTWRLPPQTPADYGNIVLFSLAGLVFCISVWQLGWLLLALIARQTNSSSLTRLIHKCGTKGAQALLSSSLVISSFSGTAMAATQQDIHVAAVSTAAQTCLQLEKPNSFQEQKASNKDQSPAQTAMSDFTWGANLEPPHNSIVESNLETPSAQTYRIVKGDSLWKIAKNELRQQSIKPSNHAIHEYVEKLYRLNKNVIGSNPNLIYPGTILTLPTVDHNINQPQSLEGTK